MNILITRFPYQSQLSGEEWHTITLAEKLRERGHAVFLASSCPHLLSEFRKRNFNTKKVWGYKPPVTIGALFTFTILSPFIFLRLSVLLLTYKLRHHIDVLYALSLNEKLLITPVARLLGMRIIWIEHARIGRWLLKNPFLPVYRLFNRLFVEKVIFVSNQSKNRLPDIPNATVIGNGIDLFTFNPDADHQESKKILPQKSQHESWIGTITRLSKDKGIPELVFAFKKLARQFPHLHCYIVGEGLDEKKYRDELSGERIHFIEAIPHEYVVDFLKKLDIFILPSSEHDPFGLVAAEAMASGIPVIVTDVCGITDFVENRKHIFIVPAQNSDALAQALSELLSNDDYRFRLAQCGYTFAKEHFDVEKMVDRYEEVLTSTAAKRLFNQINFLKHKP